MAIEEITGFTDINVGDKIYRNIDTGFIGKVRLGRLEPINGGDAFSISVSKADGLGKAVLRNPEINRSDALAAVASGEPAAAYFIVGAQSTISMYTVDINSSPAVELLNVIALRLADTELFALKQADVETIYLGWGI